MHFNTKEYIDVEKAQKFTIRYGVVEEEDLIRDLKFWETLCVSSIMMRPYEIF